MKIAHINNNGKLLGWYDSNIHNNIPTPNIGVTEEQWQEAIDNNHNKVNNDGTTEVFDFRTNKEIILEENEQKITEAKQYLLDTDWVVVKINEVAITGGDTAPLLTKYADILSERENKRLTINQLEGSI